DRPDEAPPCGSAGTRELGILREEAVPRVHGLCAAVQRGLHDIGHRKIALTGGGWAEPYRDVCSSHMGRCGVGIAVDRDRANTHVSQRVDNTNRDLATVGYQHSVEHVESHPEYAVGNIVERSIRRGGQRQTDDGTW